MVGSVARWAEARGRDRDAREAPAAEDLYDVYRVDALDPVRGTGPEGVQVLTEGGPGDWPLAVRQALEERVRREWPENQIYGPVSANLGLWLRYPLVTAQVNRRVLVPVIGANTLPIEGRLELPEPSGPRRVIVLVDASASANTTTLFRSADGRTERIPVLEAERRALDHLVGMLDDAVLELGVIAFGESTWPIAKPGRDPEALARALAQFRQTHPRGEGRTDAVCALWTAVDMLEDTPRGADREIVVLTDGDLPHSGRFTECSSRGRHKFKGAQAACEARRNQTTCPATHKFGRGDGMSDIVQLASFGRKARKRARVHPLVFEADRNARVWEQVAQRTRGRVVRVPSPQAIEVALPALVSRRIKGVFARNATSGRQTGDLLGPDRSTFTGLLPLVSGANDVEIAVESDRGVSGLFRFRVYAEPGYLERYLAKLRHDNRSLEERVDTLVEQGRRKASPRQQRDLEIRPEPEVPAAPAPR